MSRLDFALPPSMGEDYAAGRVKPLERHLSRQLGADVHIAVAPDYRAMERNLLDGKTHAAWAPPLVCAWAEAYGGRGLVRGIRDGTAMYRAALVARRGDAIRPEQPGLRAAWVDRDSMAGYLLPQVFLRERGSKGDRSFSDVRFLGSFKATLEAVLDGRADLTACWMRKTAAGQELTAMRELLGARADELEIVGLTQECPNDGVALSPKASAEQATALERAFLSMHDDSEGRTVLKTVFRVERFEPAPRGSYRALHDLVFKAVTG